MLAYVFWHWKQRAIPASEYESLQRAFHAALAAAPSDGFSRSFTVALSGAPWLNAGGEGYEDWYLVRDSAALDPLNEAAVTASRQSAHAAAAAAVAGGAAGLYRLRLGDPLTPPRHAQWFAKPQGMSYPRLWEMLAPVLRETGAALWMRQMVLGPTPEMCVHSATALKLPSEISAASYELRAVWG
ncbi:MAG: hypothetical protein ACREON_18365 [Gemmatimonadaceae bacterium]